MTIKYEALAQCIIDAVQQKGGCTLDPATGTEKRFGLSVAVDKKHEVQVETLFKPALVFWLKRVASVLEANPYYCIGAWLDPTDNIVYLDVVDVLPDNKIGLVLQNAKARGQKAIYHLPTGTTLRIE